MDNIKLAEDTIKHLKDYIEFEKVNKKVLTTKSHSELLELRQVMLNVAENNIKEIKENL